MTTLIDKFNIIQKFDYDQLSLVSYFDNFFVDDNNNVSVFIINNCVKQLDTKHHEQLCGIVGIRSQEYINKTIKKTQETIKKNCFNIEFFVKIIESLSNKHSKLYHCLNTQNKDKTVNNFYNGYDLFFVKLFDNVPFRKYVNNMVLDIDNQIEDLKNFHNLVQKIKSNKPTYLKYINLIKDSVKSYFENIDMTCPIDEYANVYKLTTFLKHYYKIRKQLFVFNNDQYFVLSDFYSIYFKSFMDLLNQSDNEILKLFLNENVNHIHGIKYSFTSIDTSNVDKLCENIVVKKLDKIVEDADIDLFNSFVAIFDLLCNDKDKKDGYVDNYVKKMCENNETFYYKLNAYIDNCLRNKIKFNCSLILRNLINKDIFVNFYTQFLKNRLLVENIDINKEVSFLNVLKLENIFGTEKCYKLVTDFILSNRALIQYRKLHIEFINHQKQNMFNQSILNVLTVSFGSNGFDFNKYITSNKQLSYVGDQLKDYLITYTQFYNDKYKERNLFWFMDKGNITYTLTQNENSVDINCNPLQSIIIEMFNDKTSLSEDQIKSNPIISDLDKNCYKILLTSLENSGLLIKNGDMFEINVPNKNIDLIDIFNKLRNNEKHVIDMIKYETHIDRETVLKCNIIYESKQCTINKFDMYNKLKTSLSKYFDLSRDLFDTVLYKCINMMFITEEEGQLKYSNDI
jgi:DNA-dependent RNA polymerase auxiliary subunit epsilon